MNKKPYRSLEFANSRLKIVLLPISLNSTSEYKAKNSLKSLSLG
jgi:hypothetical protein